MSGRDVSGHFARRADEGWSGRVEVVRKPSGASPLRVNARKDTREPLQPYGSTALLCDAARPEEVD